MAELDNEVVEELVEAQVVAENWGGFSEESLEELFED